MDKRLIADRVIVVMLCLFGVYNSMNWFSEQFFLNPVNSNLEPGGGKIESTLTPLIAAVLYQLMLGKSYQNQLRDAIVIILLFSLICIGMVNIGLAKYGIILSSICIVSLLYIESPFLRGKEINKTGEKLH